MSDDHLVEKHAAPPPPPAPIEATPPPLDMSPLDRLTMECMGNRKFFRRCLPQTDALHYQELLERSHTLNLYKDPLLVVTAELLEDFVEHCFESSKYSSKINAAFEKYVSLVLEHLEHHSCPEPFEPHGDISPDTV